MESDTVAAKLVTVLAFGWALGGASASAIDWAPIRLGTLISASNAIVIGTISDIGGGAVPGATVATLQIEQTLAGTAPASVVLERTGDETDEPLFHVQEHVLVFLRPAATQQAEFDVVDPRGVIGIQTQQALHSASDIVALAVKQRISLADDRPFFTLGAEAPPRLVAWLLEELQAHLTANDAPALEEMACGAAQDLIPAARLWAIGRVGVLGDPAARPCLETLAGGQQGSELQLHAIAALGDLGARASIPTLLPFIQVAAKPADDGQSRPRAQTFAAVLALGKIGDPSTADNLLRLALAADDLALRSTIVHALGLIGGSQVRGPLRAISRTDSSPLVRNQALRTLEQLSIQEKTR